MRVLVACEESGTVRDAFAARGHEAWSCDLLATRRPMGHHVIGDALGLAYKRKWDLMVAHPPCTYIAVCGARWINSPEKVALQREALEFMRALYEAPIARVAVENPIGVFSTWYGKPDQIIQPWQFGHKEVKATCLWLRNLPPLVPTAVVGPPPAAGTPERKAWEKIWRMPPGPDRARERSVTYQGIAEAMAAQWG